MRELAIVLLNDDHGISREAWAVLRDLLDCDEGNDDIIGAVRITDDRVYLPSDFSTKSP